MLMPRCLYSLISFTQVLTAHLDSELGVFLLLLLLLRGLLQDLKDFFHVFIDPSVNIVFFLSVTIPEISEAVLYSRPSLIFLGVYPFHTTEDLLLGERLVGISGQRPGMYFSGLVLGVLLLEEIVSCALDFGPGPLQIHRRFLTGPCDE